MFLVTEMEENRDLDGDRLCDLVMSQFEGGPRGPNPPQPLQPLPPMMSQPPFHGFGGIQPLGSLGNFDF